MVKKFVGQQQVIRDVFFLRVDEDPGKGFNNRISKYSIWRERTHLAPRCAGTTLEDIVAYCSQFEL